MKIFRLAVLAAAAYGVKKWLDENPTAKRQVQEATDKARSQAVHAAENAKQQVEQQVEKRRQADRAGVADESGVHGDPASTTAMGPGVPPAERLP